MARGIEVKIRFQPEDMERIRYAARHETLSGYIRRIVLAEISKHSRKRPVADLETEVIAILRREAPDVFPERGNASNGN